MKDAKDTYNEQMTEDPMFWLKFIRRHQANFFDVHFQDKNTITEEDIYEAIKRVAEFYDLPMPIVNERAEILAEVITSKNADETELYYNTQLMYKAGINNHDTLTLAFVHELAHELLFNVRFMLIENELWIQELAADMLVGAFSAIGDDVATGKYKYVLRQLPASMTHPDGTLRAAIVEYGREYISKLMEQQKEVSNIRDVLKGLPAFVYEHYRDLQESWNDVQLEDEQDDSTAKISPINYDSLPDTNLLKQYYMKYKKDKEDDI